MSVTWNNLHTRYNTWTTIVKQGRLAGNKWWYKRVLPNMITRIARAKTLCTRSSELHEAWRKKTWRVTKFTCVLPRQNKKIKYLYHCLLIYTCTYIWLIKNKNWTERKKHNTAQCQGAKKNDKMYNWYSRAHIISKFTRHEYCAPFNFNYWHSNFNIFDLHNRAVYDIWLFLLFLMQL